jgi:hypothetical protein
LFTQVHPEQAKKRPSPGDQRFLKIAIDRVVETKIELVVR